MFSSAIGRLAAPGVLALVLAGMALPAAAINEPSVFVVSSIAGSKEIQDKDVPGYDPISGLQLQSYSQGSYGTLMRLTGGFRYTPSANFYSVGSDSISYSYLDAGNDVRSGVLFFLLGTYSEEYVEDFEGPLDMPWSLYDPSARVVFGSLGAISGAGGMRVGHGESAGYVAVPTPAGPVKGGGQQGSHTSVRIRLPRSAGVGVPNAPGQDDVVLRSGNGDVVEYELRARMRADYKYDLILTARGAASTPAATAVVAPGASLIDIEWWPEGADGGETLGGIWVRVNGYTLIGPLPLVNGGGLAVEHYFGSLGSTTGGLQFDVDDIRVAQTPPEANKDAVVLLSDFESGGAPGWNTGTGPSMSVVPAWTSTTLYSVSMPLALGQRGYWSSPAPQAERRLGLRANLRAVETPDMAQGLSVPLITLNDDEAKPMLRVRLRRNSSGIVLETQVRHDDGTWVGVFKPFTDLLTHRLEVQWAAASGPLASDGYVRMWLDGVMVGEVLEVDNDTRAAEWIHLGPVGSNAATGSMQVDDIQAWR